MSSAARVPRPAGAAAEPQEAEHGARAQVVDVRAGAEWPIWRLSNLAPNMFTFAGYAVASMEGLLQSLKYQDEVDAAAVRDLAGRRAKKAGRKRRNEWQSTGTLWFRGVPLDRFGPRYQALLDGAYRALFDQSLPARTALLATGNATIVHTLGHDEPAETVLTQTEFCSRLIAIRSILQAQPPDGLTATLGAQPPDSTPTRPTSTDESSGSA